MEGPTEYVEWRIPDTTPGTPERLREAFADAAGYRPKSAGERSAWEKITAQWAHDGFTVTEIRRAVAGFKSAHKGQPIHIWDVNHGISAYIALMTPRDVTYASDTDPGGVPPPPEVLRRFGVRPDEGDGDESD